MIRRVEVRNFKKFKAMDLDLAEHQVVVGPNNCGKTTMVQSISMCCEVADYWLQRVVPSERTRGPDGRYPSVDLNLFRFNSLPLADFGDLWTGKETGEPVSVWLHADQYTVGFEVLYQGPEVASVRPHQEVASRQLARYGRNPLTVACVTPLSGLDAREPVYGAGVASRRLKHARGGSVLRNMLLAISRHEDKWATLQDAVRSFFGYELSQPGGLDEILVRYRHGPGGSWHDINNAASGFLQVLLVYASALHEEGAVLMVDEPDAHLHMLLQEKIYHHLCGFARKRGSQLVVTTHSEVIINAASLHDLRFLSAGGLREVPHARHAVGTLRLETSDLVLAETETG